MDKKKEILVVRHDQKDEETLKEMLSAEYEIIEVANGRAVLEALKEHRAETPLVLLNLASEEMDGYTFLDKIRLGEEADVDNRLRYDRLTGLYNKEYFYQVVRKILDENPDKEFSVICSNLEDFKLYNDAFGRAEGDALLVRIVEILRNHIGTDAICGRYNADRFLFFVDREKGRFVRETFSRDGYSIDAEFQENILLKLGIYEIKDAELSVEQMCDRAQLAVESIKGIYNEFCGVYDEALREQLIREKKFTDAMDYALDNGQFIVCYQPEYSLNSDCMIGVEALVRWVHPEWGIVYPDQYIPLFEKNGFITYLDYYVWETVCKKLSEWKAKGLPIIPVSVNVSRADIYKYNLADVFVELTEKYNLEPENIRIEITETAYTENPEQITKTVRELRRKGFIAELDDFGSGYSSLNAMGQLKLDVLKLDMGFIWSELSKPAENCLLGDVINMAHRMHMTVIAEGVEDRLQMKRLQAMGCDYAQGFYFSRPMRVEELEELLKTQNYQNVMAKPYVGDELPKIMLVNDNKQYVDKFKEYFAGFYQIIEAENTKLAFDRLTENNDFYAVILSLALAKEDGADLMIKMRQNPRFWRIPIICISPCLRMVEKMPVAMDADELVCDNFPMEELHKRIERLADIVAFQIRENTLEDKANRDYLTGLYNRRGLQKALDSISMDELPMAVCMFDLDGLKTVNDSFGHDVGDHLIETFADTLLKLTKGEDIRCRYGGDEFILILKHLKNDVTVAERICADICKQFAQQLRNEGLPGATSCGIVMCMNDEVPSGQLIDKADKALYRAKRENRGGCCVYENA